MLLPLIHGLPLLYADARTTRSTRTRPPSGPCRRRRGGVAEVVGAVRPAVRGPGEVEAEARAEAAEPRGRGAAQAPEPRPDDAPGARAGGAGVAGEVVAPEEELPPLHLPLPPRHVLQVRPRRHARRPPRRHRRRAQGHGWRRRHWLHAGSFSLPRLLLLLLLLSRARLARLCLRARTWGNGARAARSRRYGCSCGRRPEGLGRLAACDAMCGAGGAWGEEN
jgi:hypothetical protein